LLVELASHATNEPELEELKTEVQAILDNRLLLHEPDLIAPLLHTFSDKLLAILNEKKKRYNVMYDQLLAGLQANDYFKKLAPDQAQTILARHQLLAKPEIKMLDAKGLHNQLQKISLDTWNIKMAALADQFQSALEDAVLLSAPKAKTYTLPRKTITNKKEIDLYLNDLKAELENLLNESSSIILK
jgi:hypothetical protein